MMLSKVHCLTLQTPATKTMLLFWHFLFWAWIFVAAGTSAFVPRLQAPPRNYRMVVQMTASPTTSRPTAQTVARGEDSSFLELYIELANRAIDFHKANKSPSDQLFICVAGGPGSGKSTLSELVSGIINEKIGEETSTVLPMDGYHITRANLEAMGTLGQIIGDLESASNGQSTTYMDLLARRGSPWTFDAEMLKQDFRMAKHRGEAALPTYDRDRSDPVPGGAVLTKDHKIVFCEGLYLCAFDSPDWEPLRDLWDDTWYVTAPEDVILERLISRHLLSWTDEKTELWGPGREGAEAKARANDFKNAVWVEKYSRHHADLVIEHH